jgi:hypothetical protein
MSISVKNISSAKVVLRIPDIRFNRSLMPGRVITLTEDEYKELVQEPGCRNLLNGHYIKITGVEEDKAVEEVANVFEASDIAAMLDKLDITAFAKFIPNATAAEKETVIKLAVEKGITNAGFVALIKKYCDVDIINAINVKHQAEEK